MVGMALAKSLYAISTWTRTVRLVRQHAALRLALGCADESMVPSIDSCYRFTRKLRAFGSLLDRCIDHVIGSLATRMPEMGRDVAIDGSDMAAYANGQRYLSENGPEREKFSDPDASWGHRSAVSTQGRRVLRLQGPRRRLRRDGPAARVDRRDGERRRDELRAAAHRRRPRARVRRERRHRGQGLRQRAVPHRVHGSRHLPRHAAARDDRSQARRPSRPVVRARRVDVRRGRLQAPGDEVALPDRRVPARVPVGQGGSAAPARPPRVGAVTEAVSLPRRVEREFGRLKHDWALLPLRVRGLERVRLHADLTILAKLAFALNRARTAPRAA
jgi:hypothetical protein